MTIGILYESKEWSIYALRDHIAATGVPVKLFDLQDNVRGEDLLSCELIVNRVFASAVFRGHQTSMAQMPSVFALLKNNGIPMVNPYEAHFYEISKAYSTKTLEAHSFPVPRVYGVFTPKEITATTELEYPCVVKPDCGGRTTYTFIVKDKQDLRNVMANAPDIRFITQEYIFPEYGYLTRIEVIDRSCRLILKRSIEENGLSAYHLGSTYTPYDDCAAKIKDTATNAMDLLQIEVGSLDIIENSSGFYIIDVNSVSNVSEDNTEMFHFDLMKETAAYVVGRYKEPKEHCYFD